MAALAAPLAAEAQSPVGKVPRIGFLVVSSRSSVSTRIEAFRQGLRELGHVEGRTVFIEYRYAEGKLDRLPALASELVQLKVDVIVTASPAGVQAARNATSTIPIVFAVIDDPVGSGFVASLARPGGNVTGLSTLAPELDGKRLELLKEAVPTTVRVGVLVLREWRRWPAMKKGANRRPPPFVVSIVVIEWIGVKVDFSTRHP